MGNLLKLETWRQIIESRKVYNQNKTEEWYKDRKAICDSCPFNSKNKKDKTFKEKVIDFFYLGGDYCTFCGCPTKYLCSLKYNECSLCDDPKWTEVKDDE